MLSLSRFALVASAALLLSGGGIQPGALEAGTLATTTPETPAIAAEESGGQARIEVRLRKLHLVRPDLIPYPIHYDIYC